MKTKICLLIFFQFCFSFLQFSQSTLLIGNTLVEVDTVYSGLDIPWEITLDHEQQLWVTERSGLISKINPETKTRTILLDLTNEIYQEAEAGLLGLALHPDFSNNPFVFIAYTYGTTSVRERIVKYRYFNNALIEAQILLDNIGGTSTHNGARLFFLPDTTLLISTGDAQMPNLSQNISSLNGKILRMNANGEIPLDNPDNSSYVYSFGHRNVQGIANTPGGKIFLSEHGASNDDEFQVLEENRNYGWPNVEGFCNTGSEQTFCNTNQVKEPILTWTPTIAPSDMIFYENSAFPEFHNKMLMTVLKDKKLIALELNEQENQVISEEHYLTDQFDRLRDICVGNNKEIYLATSGTSWFNSDPFTHAIIRITPPIENLSVSKEQDIFNTYPNPSKGFINIPAAKFKKLEILSSNGTIINSITIGENQNIIDFNTLENGTYIFSFQTVDGRIFNTIQNKY
jgi:glucose/arabinose dehydrogenase